MAMTLSGVIGMADNIKPNAFDTATKTQWVNEVEGLVQTEVMLLALEEIITYDYTTNANTKLLVEPPHDKLYWAYLTAMIDFANGEYNKYQNTMQVFNAFFGEYMRWYALHFRPADGEAVEQGYYLSAYGIAVKHGYEGTEEEWLAGLKGDKGDGVSMRYENEVVQWMRDGDEAWQDLFSVDTLRGQVVAETLAIAEAAQEGAETAQAAAEAAAQQAAADAQSAADDAAATERDRQTASEQAQVATNQAEASQQSATDAAEAQAAAEAAKIAAESAQAKSEAEAAEAEKAAQTATDEAEDAKNSGTRSESWAVGGTNTREGEDENNAKYWAGVAQAEAESVKTPPVEGVYNIVLADRSTGDRYALIVEDGRLYILGVKPEMEATDMTLVDIATGIGYSLVVEDGRLTLEEV